MRKSQYDQNGVRAGAGDLAVDASPEAVRARHVRWGRLAIRATNTSVDLASGRVYIAGRGRLDIQETVLSMTLVELAQLLAESMALQFPASVPPDDAPLTGEGAHAH